MNKFLASYKNAYSGISRDVWILSVIQLINRSGSMVLPFLTIYMTESLGFDVKTAGIVMSFYGIGSILGAFLGGKFTDKIGPFQVMFFTMFAGGISYFLLPLCSTPYLLAGGIFLCASINEGLRPANSSMVANFAQGDSFTRSFSLLRMAVNLGVAIGPAVAGALAGIDYKLLFFGDGLTNLAAATFLYFYFRNKKPIPHPKEKENKIKDQSPFRDARYLLFIFLCLLYATAFFQILNGIPLYYKNVYFKSEQSIGLLIGFNGLIVFIFEMITVFTIENKYRPSVLIFIGSMLLAVSFLLFNIAESNFILIVSMILLSFSEIFAMPFMISHVVHRSKPRTRGSYIAAYTMMWSLSLILAPFVCTNVIAEFDYNILWWVMTGLCIITAFGFAIVMKEKSKPGIKAGEVIAETV